MVGSGGGSSGGSSGVSGTFVYFSRWHTTRYDGLRKGGEMRCERGAAWNGMDPFAACSRSIILRVLPLPSLGGVGD